MEVVLTAYYREDVSQLDTGKLERLKTPNGIPIAPTGSKIKLGKTQEKKLKTR